MNKKTIFIFIVSLLTAMLFGCLPVEEEDDAQVRKWNISGIAKYSSSADTTHDVKLGLFYINSTTVPSSLSTSYKLVSSAANLGNSGGTNIDFSIDVDCTETTPSNSQLLGLFMWRDNSGNDTFTSGDKSTLCVSTASGGSQCFTDGSDDAKCVYLYVGYNGDVSDDLGTQKGWNQIYGKKYKGLKKAAVKRGGVYSVSDAVVEGSL